MARQHEDDPRYVLERAEEQLRIYRALVIALDHVHELVQLLVDLGGDPDMDRARSAVSGLLGVDELAARAILDLQLRRLIGFEQPKVRDECGRLEALCEHLRRSLRAIEQ